MMHFTDKINNLSPFLFQSLFNGNESLQIRYDLLDCNICICSTTVSLIYELRKSINCWQNFGVLKVLGSMVVH